MFSLKVHASSQLDEESKVYLSEHKQIPVVTEGELCLLKGGCEDCELAAENGHLECLKWLHEKGAPGVNGLVLGLLGMDSLNV